VYFQQRLLNQIGRVALGTQVATELGLCQKPEIVTVTLEKLFAGLSFSLTAALNEFGCGHLGVHGRGVLSAIHGVYAM
jgi:hypothetical protein